MLRIPDFIVFTSGHVAVILIIVIEEAPGKRSSAGIRDETIE